MDTRVKHYLIRFLWLLFVPLTWLLILLAKQNPAIVEHIYSKVIYPVISFILPFRYIRSISFFEVLLIFIPLSAVILLIIWIIKIIRIKFGRLWTFLLPLQNLLIAGAVLYFLFYLLWGFNYYREPYSQIADLDTTPGTAQELTSVCEDLINKANAARILLPSNADNTIRLELTTEQLQDKASQAYKTAVQKNIPGLRNVEGYGKALISSRLISYTGIEGIFFPYTGEPNYNKDIPVPLLGASLCHEMAHLQGFAREDEANFISYLVCTSSQDLYLRYSGYLLAAIHAMNQLYDADYATFAKLYGKYNKQVLSDLEADRSYWDQFEGPVSKTVDKINDSYLKANNQTDGVQSYGRMVDLLLAQYRAKVFYN